MRSDIGPVPRIAMILFGMFFVILLAEQSGAQLVPTASNRNSLHTTVNLSTIPRMVSYQGYLASGGSPFTGVANFKFVITCGGTSTAWSNDGTSAGGLEPTTAVPIQVDEGAFSVLLGDSTRNMPLVQPNTFDGCLSVDLKVWVDTGTGFEELPAQPIASAMFALEADAAYRGIGGFSIEEGSLIMTDLQDQQTIQLLPFGPPGSFDGPAMYMTNSSAQRTILAVADSAETGNPYIQLKDNTGTSQIVLDGATGEVQANAIRFSDDTVQTTAVTGTGGGPDADWTVSGNDMYASVPGNVGVGTSVPVAHLTLSRPTQAPKYQLAFWNEGSIQEGNYDGIRFAQGVNGEQTLAEMRLDYRNNGIPDLGFHLRGQSNVLYLEGSTGHVGVGTGTPTAPLEVTGTGNPILYVRQEQLSGADAAIAIRGSRNASATANAASVEFRDFDDDEGLGTDFLMARIGAGLADPSGQTGFLRFYTNNGGGETEQMRIDKNGNVGIGTSTPASTLDVAGDLTVSGTINATGVSVGTLTRYVSLAPAAFTPELDTMNYKKSGSDLYGTTPGQLVRFNAAVALPHGAVIKEIRFGLDDNDTGTNNFTGYLFEWPLFGGTGIILAHQFTLGAPGNSVQLAQAITQTVDNVNNYYYVSIDWTTPGSGNVWDIRLHGVRITYEITELAP